MAEKQRLIGILGPTASGKTASSLALAEALGGEILCMDALQVYRRMDIGTAKPTKAEQARVPHHLLDIREPGQDFSVAEYTALARPLILEIAARGRLPLLVGGTGLYLRALALPLSLGNVPRDEAIRARLQALLAEEGGERLHCRLAQVDEASARRLHPNDTRRVIRALEVYEVTGRPFSAQTMPAEADSPYRLLLYARDLPREMLYRRIDERVDAMMAAGLADEVRALLAGGLSPEAQCMQGLGYKELLPWLRGGGTKDEAVESIKRRTRNYAKRQLTWFRADPRIAWLPCEMTEEDFIKRVQRDGEQA
ncbi:MAG: tRNA (adenosine(37)-N6)-dimethylallyltransferase MiaA [Christensenellales bacterium]